MSQMMFHKKYVALIFNFLLYHSGQAQLFIDPGRHGTNKSLQRKREHFQMLGQNPLQLQKRFFIKTQIIYIFDSDTLTDHTILDGFKRERSIMLLTGESFLLSRGYHYPILH